MRQSLAWFPLLEEINDEIPDTKVTRPVNVDSNLANPKSEFSVQGYLKRRQEWFPVFEDIPEESKSF